MLSSEFLHLVIKIESFGVPLLFHFLHKTLYKPKSFNMTLPLAYLAYHFEYSKPIDSQKVGKAKCLRCENYDKAINST
jgi:hypothetical protein